MSFRIDPTKGLSQQEVFAAKNSLESLKEDDFYFRKCNLIVKHKLQFGQTLYLRGDSNTNGDHPFYGWDRKLALINIGPDTWTIPISFLIKKTDKVAFKFLIDDKDWEEGENHNFQDLLLLTQKSFVPVNKEERKFNNENSNYRFRINPEKGLSKQEMSTAKIGAEFPSFGHVIKDDYFIPRKCDLIVKRQLQFGQTLYLRGECIGNDNSYIEFPGLGSWGKGSWGKKIELKNIGPDTWTIPISFLINKTDKVAFKFLIDNKDWEEGENHNFQDLLLLTQKSCPFSNRPRFSSNGRCFFNSFSNDPNIFFSSSSSGPSFNSSSNPPRSSSSSNEADFFASCFRDPSFFSSFFDDPNFFGSFSSGRGFFSYSYSYTPPSSSSSSSYRSSSSSSSSSGPSFNSFRSEPMYTFNGKGFNNKDELANYIKNILENTFGTSFSDSKTLTIAYRSWSLKNHPDKVAPGDREQATERFAKAKNLVDYLKELKGWN